MIAEKVRADWKWCPRCRQWCSVWNRRHECLWCNCKLRDEK